MAKEMRIEMEERVQVNLTISKEALNMMDELAKHNLRSRSNMFEVLLRQFYKEYKNEQVKPVQMGESKKTGSPRVEVH
ncbi:MAG: hypothetical protein K8R40_02445 [Anaerolineaceae bacterium]|nr:hypothetical protein [Anaerolineaceae bacterium]